jgi:hypothetical protein
MMSYDDYMQDRRRAPWALRTSGAAEDRVEVEEIQLTTDGEEDYSYGNQGRGRPTSRRGGAQEAAVAGDHLVP